MSDIRRKSAVAGATIALALSTGLTGCAPRVVQPVPVPVAPVGGSYEQQFVDEARYQGDFSAMSDYEILDLGQQVCYDLDTQPNYVSTKYYDYFVTLSVQYICPEHQATLYQLGY